MIGYKKINLLYLLVGIICLCAAILSNHGIDLQSVSFLEDEYGLYVHFIDVGQGDCTLVELPDGKVALIDGGDSQDGHHRRGRDAQYGPLGVWRFVVVATDALGR